MHLVTSKGTKTKLRNGDKICFDFVLGKLRVRFIRKSFSLWYFKDTKEEGGDPGWFTTLGEFSLDDKHIQNIANVIAMSAGLKAVFIECRMYQKIFKLV